ncbi:hypothetical protein LP420_41645 [Massilia sp. B-10]|nr:hypothetical protein LP420_41645 [Massilia sp. B-10]
MRDKFAAMAADIGRATGNTPAPEAVAEGFIQIAVGNMANAIKQISVQRGHDVTEYVLTSFGGAAWPACLPGGRCTGHEKVFVHSLAGVMSAYGMGLADQSAMREEAVELRLADIAPDDLEQRLARLGGGVAGELAAQGVAEARIRLVRRVHLRYEGTDSAIIVLFGDAAHMKAQFETAYKKRFSFLMPSKALVAEAISVEAIGVSDAPAETILLASARAGGLAPFETVDMYAAGAWRKTGLYQRAGIRIGDTIA